MRAVVQRVSRAEVRIEGRVAGKIGRGLLVLLGVADGDSDADAAFLVDRIVGMRIFADDAGKMNLSIAQAGGELLVVSQFTLIADTNSGRRPSFIKAAAPDAFDANNVVCRQEPQRHHQPVAVNGQRAQVEQDRNHYRFKL